MSNRLQENQSRIKSLFENGGFVPVFSLSTHEGRNTIYEDAIAKAEAMIAGGASAIEFLNRGDSTLPLTEYTEQLMDALEYLAEKHPEVSFGVGTVANEVQAAKIAERLGKLKHNNGFMVSAHKADKKMLDIIASFGVSIIPTSSNRPEVKYLKANGKDECEPEDAYIVAPGEGSDVLDPEYIRQLREVYGMNVIKVFDAKKIGMNHAKPDVPSDRDAVLHTVLATAKAFSDSYQGGKIPAEGKFYAMGTGGFTQALFQDAIAAMKNPDMQAKMRKMLGDDADADKIMDIVKRTVFATGGTFITAEYDAAINKTKPGNGVITNADTAREGHSPNPTPNSRDEAAFRAASEALTQKTRDCVLKEQLARKGIVPPLTAVEKVAVAERKTLILGEPLVQYKMQDGLPEQYVGTAGDSYNFALTLHAMQEKYGNSMGKLYFGTSFGGTAEAPTKDDAVFLKELKDRGIDVEAFVKYDADRKVGRYNVHHAADGVVKPSQERNSYARGNAAARFYFDKEQAAKLKEQLITEGITQVVASHIMLGNCNDRESYLDFLNFAKANGVDVIWADNYRAAVWKQDPDNIAEENNPALAAKYSKLAAKCATRMVVSFDDEAKMHGDKTPYDTIRRLHSYGVKHVAVTNEGKPTTVSYIDGKKIRAKEVIPAALEVKSKDKNTAGAGDCFAAAYMHQIMQGKSMDEAAYNATIIASRVLSLPKDNLSVADLPEEFAKPYEFESHPAYTSVRYFYRADPATGEFDPQDKTIPAQENMLRQMKAAQGVNAVTTSLHKKPKGEAFTAWEIVKMLKHIEYDLTGVDDKIDNFPKTEAGALAYLEWLRTEGKETGIKVMNFEDSRTSDRVKYGEDGRDSDIKIEGENRRVLSVCGLNSEDRKGFCYTTNFMTPFDWFRTDMKFKLPDGSEAMAVRAELLAMFDRYVINIEPDDQGYYAAHYTPDVLARAEKMWKEDFGQTDMGFQKNLKIEAYGEQGTALRDFIESMLAGNAGSNETEKYNLEEFRRKVKGSRYLGQDPETAKFENDKDGSLAHRTAQEHLRYYGEKLEAEQQRLGHKPVPFVLHPDDTADVLSNRGDMGVFRVVSTSDDLVLMYKSFIGNNFCTGCFGSARGVAVEADVFREAIEKIRALDPEHSQERLELFTPFLHLRKVVRGDETLENFSANPEIRKFIAQTQESLHGIPGSIAELPHHVALTPLFKTLEVMHENKMLHVVRPDHTTSLDFHMDYRTGEIVDGRLGQPGYDATRIMSSQMIRVILDALHNLDKESAREFVTHFENKLCTFGLDSQEGYKERLAYLRDLDFGAALTEFRMENDFKPVFTKEGVADAITSGRIRDCRITQLSQKSRETELALAA